MRRRSLGRRKPVQLVCVAKRVEKDGTEDLPTVHALSRCVAEKKTEKMHRKHWKLLFVPATL